MSKEEQENENTMEHLEKRLNQVKENHSEGLPTAEIGSRDNLGYCTAKPTSQEFPEFEVGDVMTRIKDVEALIEEKIEEWENSNYCKDQYGDSPLKELLEEVKASK